MKLTKTLLTTALFALSTAMISPVSYANNDAEMQMQQGFAAAQKGDYYTAFKLWKPLAEKGNATAQFNLGLMYSRGQGVKQDDFQAFKWYQKAAEQGNAKAQLFLGGLYALGQGVKQDEQQAKYWAGKSCDNGDQDGCNLYLIVK